MILDQHKIVFAGAMGAGKTTAIKTLSDIDVLSTEAINTDTTLHQKMFTTVGIDYGEINLDEHIKISLFGTPGQKRFDFIWNMICKGTLGIVILIDHSADNPVEQLQYYLDVFGSESHNIIIGITHVENRSNLSTSIYRDFKDHNSNKAYPIFFVDARVKNDILLLVEALIANAEVQFEI